MLVQTYKCKDLVSTIEAQKAVENAYEETTLYCLSASISAGEQITPDMVTTHTIKVPRQTKLTQIAERSEIKGHYAKTSLEKGCVLSKDMFFEDETLTTKSRRLELTDIRLPEKLSETDLIEIRISFPTGEDFVIIEHQKILHLLSNEDSVYGISISLSEEDLLRLSSARVDQNIYDGTYLYAVIYQADFETAAETDYPVNADTFSLMQWDPNIVSLFTVEKEQEKRAQLEEHLQNFMQGETMDSIELETEDYNISQM